MKTNNFSIIHGEIALATADVIINAANGCGYMGGKRCRKGLHRGVAEHINYYSKGIVEDESLKESRKYPNIPSFICGHKAGDFFVTGAGGLKCDSIIHAVTMRYPASRSSIKAIQAVVRKIFEYCSNAGYKIVALPCLGCGNGGLSSDDVIRIIQNESEFYPELMIKLYVL